MKINQIITGNCLEVLAELEDNSVDVTITSPPYFQQRNYGNGLKGIGNEQDESEYLEKLLRIFWETVRVTKDTGTIVFNLGDKYINGGLSLLPYKFAIEATKNKEIFLINQITWSKLNPTPRQDKRKLIQATEPFFVFAKSKNYHFDLDNYLKHFDDLAKNSRKKPSEKLGKRYFDLIDNSGLTEIEKQKARAELKDTIQAVFRREIDSFRMKIRGIHKLAYGGQAGGRNNQIKNQGYSIIKIHGKKMKKDIVESPVETTKNNSHPAVYPLYIIQELIKLLSKPDDIILDPFSGSGTTCLAAQNLSRNYIGIEINTEYVKLSKERLQKEAFNHELFV